MSDQPSDELLVAYLDGELDDAGIAEVEARLDAEPALRARLHALSETTMQLRDAFEGILREPVPQHLLRAATAETSATILRFPGRLPVLGGRSIRVPRGLTGFALAASLIGILFGGGATYLAGLGQTASTVLENVAATHDYIVTSAQAGENAVFDVPAGAEQRLPGAIRIPNMAPWGLTFMGARHFVERGKSAYAFYFTTETQPGPITVAIWPSAKPDLPATFERHDKYNQVYWRQGGHGFAITGQADQANRGYLWNMYQDVAFQLRNN